MPEIYRNGVFYRLVKHTVNFGLWAYFGNIVIKGRENLPTGNSYILAPNHQNAFLDALLMLQLDKWHPTVFLARADIFGNGLAAKVLRFLKIMPVYRARDGKKSLAQNDFIFKKSIDVLLHHIPFCMMAEGTHNDRRQLLPLKKGMFRIAFAAKEQMGDESLFIVPVGIDYQNYSTPGNAVVVNIGQPISIDGYMEGFRQNNALAINQLKEGLRVAITAQMHNIQSVEHYDEFYLLSKLYADSRCTECGRNGAWQRFKLRREMSQRLDLLEKENPQKVEEIVAKIVETEVFCHNNGVDMMRIFEKRNMAIVVIGTLLLVGIPVALAVIKWRLLAMLLLLCPIPFLPTRLLFRHQSDQQFVGSLNYAVQFVLSIVYLIVMTAFVCINEGWLFAILALLACVCAWRWGHVLAQWVTRLFNDWKLLIFKRKIVKKAKDKMSELL